MKEVVIGRLFYVDQLFNAHRFDGLEDKGKITDGVKTATVRISVLSGRIVFIVPAWIKNLDNWKAIVKN